MLPVALTIAGSDPSGGAGIQADLKTFHQFGVYGEAVITLLTVQNTLGVSKVEVMPAALVAEQIEAVLADIKPGAAKTGALGNAEVVEAISALASRFDFPLVVDPVMISKHGSPLLSPDAVAVFKTRLLPVTTLLTPNLDEASALSGLEIRTLAHMREAARHLVDLGPKNVLVKGGHLTGEPVDVFYDGSQCVELPGRRIQTPHTHGTGCTYAAAITALLATGLSLQEAVTRSKHFIQAAIETAPGLGSGNGPVNHFASVEKAR